MTRRKHKEEHQDKHKEKEEAPEEKEEKKPPRMRVEIDAEEYEKLLAGAKELAEIKDALLRKAADFDNAKKRLARDREEFIKFANEQLMRDLLPVIDNLERALAYGAGAYEQGDPLHLSRPFFFLAAPGSA